MRLIYLDEAGISAPRQEPFSIVCGVGVEADAALIPLEDDLEGVVGRHIPENARTGFVLHATHLFNGGGSIFRRDTGEWPLERRLAMADEVAALPAKHGLQLLVGAVEREKHPLPIQFASRNLAVHHQVLAFTGCLFLIEDWMRKCAPREICMLVIEENQQAKRTIEQVFDRFRDPRLRETLDVAAHVPLPARHVKEQPLFQKKNPGSVLQLADFCAYVQKRALMGDPKYARFTAPMAGNVQVYQLAPT